MTTILELRDVSRQYHERPVLDIPAFQVQAGEIVGLAGPNGSGKSTLLKLLAFVETATRGQVLYQGKPALPFDQAVRFQVSLLTQEPYLLKRTVFDNVAYGLKARGQRKNLATAVASALQLAGLDESFAGRQWHELSGGEAQRVALAARLAIRPGCLLLDEPTTSVDMQSAEKIRHAVLMARREWRTTLVIASHSHTWLDAICDRVVFLFKGRLVDFGLENIFYGPWEKNAAGKYCQRLADGQELIVPQPPSQESGCVIAPALTTITDRPVTTAADNQLAGKIMAISNGKPGLIKIQVVCAGEHTFAVSVPEEHFVNKPYLPGHDVRLHFSSADMIWLPS